MGRKKGSDTPRTPEGRGHGAAHAAVSLAIRHRSGLSAGLDFWEAGYHKNEEFEAHREGMYLAVQSDYSPYGAVDLFERFAKLCDEYVIHAKSPDEELSQLAIQSLSGYFRSHPLPSERLAQANRIILQEHWESRTARKPFHVEYEVHNGEFVK